MEVRLKTFLKQRDPLPYEIYLGVPHRLDRPASGAMVFATRLGPTRKLSKQFERREVQKVYWACVAGQLDPPAGTWRDHVRKVYGKPQAEVVPADHPEARLAVLHYRTLASAPWGSWLEIELETGRTHQVRIQAASRGYPLLGDFQYGSIGSLRPPTRRRAFAGDCAACSDVGFSASGRQAVGVGDGSAAGVLAACALAACGFATSKVKCAY